MRLRSAHHWWFYGYRINKEPVTGFISYKQVGIKSITLALLFLNFGFISRSQTPYTATQFAIDSLMNVTYGTAIDYAGNTDTLKLDIYKPVGDANCLRPVIVLVHGGSWIGGSKQDYNQVYMSRELAKKGWVVANINYRLGTHKTSNYAMYLFCSNSISQPCAYICDSAEIFRANFRAMQDAKGAIRFMKNRNETDSTDINNVYIAGESAGGFISFATAFTDQLSEKNICCYSIANAPNPDPDLGTYGCIPSQNNLNRPDLGSIEGDLNQGAYNSSVKGIGNFYGGVFDLNIFQQTAETPCLYLFHQGSDVIVNYNYGIVLGRISWECYAQTNLCQSYYFYPYAFGSEGLRQHFVTLGSSAPVYQADIISNYSYLNNCFSNGHSIDNIQVRLQNMVALFAQKIAAAGNNPLTNCQINSASEKESVIRVTLFPNPATNQVFVKMINSHIGSAYTITDSQGKTLMKGILETENKILDISQLSPGIYLFSLADNSKQNFKLVKN